MAGGSAQGWYEADELRRLVPIFALAVLLVAALAEPSSSAVDLVLGAVPVVAFGLWAYLPNVPLPAVALPSSCPVVVAQRSGQLEPLMFELVLLAFVVGRWSPSRRTAVVLGVLTLASPVAVILVQDPAEVAVANWLMGIVFPWLVGRAFAHHAQLAAELDATRRELAGQALLAERRRIARDVHDFVGHGLAAVMLQVTSARHVLRRDLDAAEDALRSAEWAIEACRSFAARWRSSAATTRQGWRRPSVRRRDLRAGRSGTGRRSRGRAPCPGRPRVPPSSASPSTGSPRRRSRMRLATRRVRNHPRSRADERTDRSLPRPPDR